MNKLKLGLMSFFLKFWSLKVKLFIATVLSVGLTSCQYVSFQQPKQVELASQPMWIRSFFGGCADSDGSRKLSVVLNSNHLKYSLDHDWIYDGTANLWRAQLTDPVGRVVFDGGNLIDSKGFLLWSVNKVGIPELLVSRGKKNHLMIRDVKLPLFYHEIPCIFYGQLPVDWLYDYRWQDKTDLSRSSSRIWSYSKGERSISLEFSKHKGTVLVQLSTPGYGWGLGGVSLDWFLKLGEESTLSYEKLGKFSWKTPSSELKVLND